MGLIASIYRNRHGSGSLSIFHDVDEVTLVNVEGPFEPSAKAPAAVLCEGPLPGTVVVRPADSGGLLGRVAMGGAFVESSDARFREAVQTILRGRFYGAVALHDWDMARDTQTGD